MERIQEHEIVIVGGGIAGFTTCLALHRMGLRSIVLESWDSLRISGFALTLWTNAWKALDAVGIGDSLRKQSLQMQGFTVASLNSDLPPLQSVLAATGKYANHECRCVKRKDLLETMLEELPHGSVRFSSKVVLIEKSGLFKLIHLADGAILKTKVLIGCDGVKSVVAKELAFQEPLSSGRSAIRGLAEFSDGHGLEPKINVHFGNGVRFGFVPCDVKCVYWFCTFTPSPNNSNNSDEKAFEEDPLRMKQFVLGKIASAPRKALDVVERTELSHISCAELKFRLPWNVLMGNITKDNICVAGDALHPMTPDIGQGGCSSLEDAVVLARCLGEAILRKTKLHPGEVNEEEEYGRIKQGLEKYGKDRRWRSFNLISSAFLAGYIQQSEGKIMSFLREKWLAKYTADAFLRLANYDCGDLVIPCANVSNN
ncbi:monooxygenase 2 [Daucus carota subsp. sativus]|uniref:FAD-binding domain-containing protein n=1 Tax=Daucus carota subsp. sativus TaxID=79200 RepID=A0A162AGI7_DAUCS|nr:PREDICTED: FAD-dependent urate hydroxylase-like [Daucus carota subsp. sativus]